MKTLKIIDWVLVVMAVALFVLYLVFPDWVTYKSTLMLSSLYLLSVIGNLITDSYDEKINK